MNKFIPSNRPKEVNLLNVYHEETKELLKEMNGKHGKNFLETKRPPYFPTVKHIVLKRDISNERNNSLKNTNLLNYYDTKIKPFFNLEAMEKKYQLPEFSESNEKTIFNRFVPLEKELNDSYFVSQILSGIEIIKDDRGQNLLKVISLETERSELVEKHNLLSSDFKTLQEKRETLLPRYRDTLSNLYQFY
jgi:hypothetical protein